MKDQKIKFSSPPNGGEWNTANNYKLPNGNSTTSKPENMTQLHGNQLTSKNNPRIIFRGKLDTFQAQLIHNMFVIRKSHHSPRLLIQLRELFQFTQEILRSEVLNQELNIKTLLDWSDNEVKQRSHNPHLFYNLKQMVMIDETFKETVILLNLLRAQIREIELVAVKAFQDAENPREDIIKALNRMSSCFHILMYQESAFSLH